MERVKFKKNLSVMAMLKRCRYFFNKVPDEKIRRSEVTLSECLMSGLAVFGLKYPSLLQFDKGMDDDVIRSNLRSLYGIEHAPCDTYLRERLDEVEPASMRRAFTSVFSAVQREKMLEPFRFIDGSYLISVDGTGYFFSDKVHCDQCCQKHHRDGSVSYYHQVLAAVLVHPDQSCVLPLAPEPILKQDGKKKNDCERNAARRLLGDLRREHPHLKVTIVEDGLASNAPHIQTLRELGMNFILGAKEGDHAFLFDWVNKSEVSTFEKKGRDGKYYRFRDNATPIL